MRAWRTDVPSLTDLDEDYSKRKSVAGRRQLQVLRLPVTHATFADALVSKLTKDEVVDALKSLHTDPSGHVDATAVETLLGKVCAVAIDGAFTGPNSCNRLVRTFASAGEMRRMESGAVWPRKPSVWKT